MQPRGENPDVYQYEEIPQKLRVQIVHVINDLLSDPWAYDSPTREIFAKIHSILCREYGEFALSERRVRESDYRTAVVEFFLGTPDIELACRPRPGGQ